MGVCNSCKECDEQWREVCIEFRFGCERSGFALGNDVGEERESRTCVDESLNWRER